jgi:hypothetical protein
MVRSAGTIFVFVMRFVMPLLMLMVAVWLRALGCFRLLEQFTSLICIVLRLALDASFELSKA